MDKKTGWATTFRLVLIVPAVLLAFFSCKKEGITDFPVPPNDRFGIFHTDTMPIVAFTVKEDSITSTSTLYNLLGTMNDPVFGRSDASFYTQVSLSTFNVKFALGLTPQIDSVVLTLAYYSFYGNTNELMKVKVYEVAGDMLPATTYYSNQIFATDANPLLETTFIPNVSDDILVGNDTLGAHLRLRLPDSFGQELLDADTSYFASNESFMTLLRGFYIVSDTVGSNNGAIAYFDLLSSDKISGLTLYYNDSLHYQFEINSGCVRVNHFDHQYSTSPFIQQSYSDTTLGDSIIFLQSMAGLKTKIWLPQLKNLVNEGPVAIHKALLTFSVDDLNTATDIFPAPEKLYLAGVNAAGNSVFLPDAPAGSSGSGGSETEEYFGGTYNSSTKQYSFNIARYVQQLIDNKWDDYGLYLLIPGMSAKADRLVLKGSGKNTTGKITLNLTYTKL
ncbi:MAG: DUF4270 domain-containing protein [Bacteroidetes bacterium]|nr:DUF4270 domain-containing protein [Bacteroidota bacterium]MBU1719848.1 DUF4270 domain-containing protein [Bacteroidota bacterium]